MNDRMILMNICLFWKLNGSTRGPAFGSFAVLKGADKEKLK